MVPEGRARIAYGFAIANKYVGVGEINFAFAQALDFPAKQHQACLECLFDKVVMLDLFV